jgi:heat shock protein HslJ
VLAWRTERRAGDPPDQLYDPATRMWTAIPQDPLGPGFGRRYTATPSLLFLTDHAEVTNPGVDPSFVRGALLDPVSLTWGGRLGDSPQVGGVRWTWTGQRLVDPTPGTVDGGATNTYGRSYPLGGVFDPAAGAWGPLPHAPQPAAPGEPVTAPSGWPVQATGGRLSAVDGWLYDDVAETWTALPAPDGAPTAPGSAMWAGDQLIVVGGIDHPGSSDARLTDRAYRYDPYPVDDPPVAPGGEQGIGGDWELVDGMSGGRPLPAPPAGRATLSAHGNQLTGTAFCTGFGGRYRLDGERVVIDDLAQTDMACLDPGVMEGEAAFMGVLNASGTRFTRTAGELVLENGTGRLRFRPQTPVPTAQLVGTRWVLDTLIDGQVASSTVGARAELQLSDDATFTAGTGCRRLSGTWRTAGDTVYLDYEWPAAGCQRDVERQEQQVIAVLGTGFQATVDGDRLTLTSSRGGLALGYRAT